MRKLANEMRKIVVSVSVDPDVKVVMDEQRGIAKESTYVNYVLREHFIQKGLLPKKESA